MAEFYVMPKQIKMAKLTIEKARILAKDIAQKIVTHEISEYEGGTMIWKEIVDRLDKCPDDLWIFKSRASAIEDCKWNAEQGGSNNDEFIWRSEQEIFNAARFLIESGIEICQIQKS
jgi:hypothetical protein